MKKIVLTGAAGRLGSYLREPLLKLADKLVSSDIVEEIGKLHPNETYVSANLSDLPAMIELLKGADLVVHFGAIGDEAPFDEILQANIVGAYNIWEAAYQNGVKRVVYASSIHAVGMHKKTDFIGTNVPHRPDTYYGLAKCFAEDLASLYWDKRGLESVCMRILSCAQVSNPRAVGSWLSYDDLIQLVEKSITTQITGFSIVYGFQTMTVQRLIILWLVTLDLNQKIMLNNLRKKSILKNQNLIHMIKVQFVREDLLHQLN